MKFKIIYTFFAASLLLTLFLSNSNGRADQANWGNTGAPGDQELPNGAPRTCQSCHATGDIQVTLDIEISENGTPIESYVPGATYDMMVSVNHVGGPTPNGYGFQIVALVDSDESDVDGWSEVSANAKIMTASNTGRSYVEQNASSASNVFTAKWTAPEQGSGDVTFYSCGNGVDGNGATSNDGAACNTLQLSEDMGSSTRQLATTLSWEIYPNPAQNNLNIALESAHNLANASLGIFDLNGKVMAQRMLSDSNVWTETIDVSAYTQGLYLIRVQTENDVITKKFIKK